MWRSGVSGWRFGASDSGLVLGGKEFRIWGLGFEAKVTVASTSLGFRGKQRSLVGGLRCKTPRLIQSSPLDVPCLLLHDFPEREAVNRYHDANYA